MEYRKHELVVVMRHKGWKGDESRLKKEYIESWLLRNGVDVAEQTRIIKLFKSGALGGNGEQRPAAQGVTQAEVTALIDSALKRVPANDDDALKQWIADEVAKAQPHKIVIDTAASVKSQAQVIEGTHPLFEKVLKLVLAGVNVLLVGPAGCGKTTMAHHIAKALKRKYGSLHCTAGASESQLIGWLLPIGEGKHSGAFTYVPSEFVRLYEGGNSVFLLDEIDAADPNMLLVINSALANGSLHVPQRHENPHVARGKNAAILAAANTFGSGADIMYAGRNQLDAATLDRFYLVKMDYDKKLEAKLAPKDIVEWAWQMRERVGQARLRRVISTRTIQKLGAAVASGIDIDEAKQDALAGWTRDELSKVGVAS